ncbi:hypothetical protein IAU60_004743 [Kwoniella sp. DSM 27419]
MSANERIKGIQVHRPIIYGSHSRRLTDEERATAPPGHTHRWTVFLTSATSPPPAKGYETEEDHDYLPGSADDLSYLLKKVTFRLHETYPNPNRVCDKHPFKVTETGWGEFTVQIRLQFVQESLEKPLTLNHTIKLHPWGAIVPGSLVPLPGAEMVETGAAGTPATAPESTTEGDAAAGGESSVQGAEDDVKVEQSVEPEVKPSAAEDTQENKTPAAEENADTPTGSVGTAAEPTQVSEVPDTEATVSQVVWDPSVSLTMVSTLPVHAWQYDELIFSDPPRAFLDLLNEHPPTPLPGKNRRPRDQREEWEVRHPSKKPTKGVRGGTASARGSRANTEAGTPAPVSAAPPVAGLPGPGQGAGVPGEPGSADVPLEFSGEMEKGEYNRLAEARIKIVEQMDKWRERLIVQEKELARLKDEVKSM